MWVSIEEYLSSPYLSEGFDRKMEEYVNELVLDILEYNLKIPFSKEKSKKKAKSNSELRKDKPFMKAVHHFKEQMDFYYYEFIK